jgi:hypothetical protein
MLLLSQKIPFFRGLFYDRNNVSLSSSSSLLPRREQRNEQIKADFNTYHKDGFRNEIIYEKLAAKYYLAPDTIERIVFGRGTYRKQSILVVSTVPASSAGAHA